ncbi:MAG: AbrB/MazE/SpoVT family DNA-binding domain-containing protein [Armatimonadetes bacterium]|nr:AbrB/MazE/SpoVT family DNA-binding domain-containing protein [Armatimonadota bacterium]
MRICGGADLQVDDCFYGSVTVGERGQVVIPAEARNQLGIKAGDKILIMRHPIYAGLMMAKIDALHDFLDDFRRTLDRMKEMDGEE